MDVLVPRLIAASDRKPFFTAKAPLAPRQGRSLVTPGLQHPRCDRRDPSAVDGVGKSIIWEGFPPGDKPGVGPGIRACAVSGCSMGRKQFQSNASDWRQLRTHGHPRGNKFAARPQLHVASGINWRIATGDQFKSRQQGRCLVAARGGAPRDGGFLNQGDFGLYPA